MYVFGERERVIENLWIQITGVTSRTEQVMGDSDKASADGEQKTLFDCRQENRKRQRMYREGNTFSGL